MISKKDRMKDGESETGIRKKRNGIVKWAAIVLAALIFTASGCGKAGEGMEAGLQDADFFAYTDEENCLYFWKQGMDTPVLLTEKAFAEGKAEGEKAEGNAPYWEAWDYWQEWDDGSGQWVWNYESAMQGIVKEGPGDILYFPQEMRWENVCLQRSVGELEEEKKYAKGEAVDEYADVKLFLYDLYRYDGGEGIEEGRRNGKVADQVISCHIDGQGNVWYCRIEKEGRKKEDTERGTDAEWGTESAKTVLYRYDGKETIEIGEINGRKKDAYRVSQNGEYVIFFALDDRLYGCRPDGEAALMAEGMEADLFRDTSNIYTNSDMSRIIYAENSTIHIIEDMKKEEEQRIEGTGEYLAVGMLGEDGDKIYTLSVEEETPYTDWIELGEGEKGEDAEKLWELLEKYNTGTYPILCHVQVMDISSVPAKCIQKEDGYLLAWLSDCGMENPHKVYCEEMIPAGSFEKVKLADLLGETTPAELLEAYEYRKEDEYYIEAYGEELEEQAFTEAFDSCIERDVLNERGKLCVITEAGIRWLEESGGEIGAFVSGYGESNDMLYLKRYRYTEQDEGGYPFHFYYSYLEDELALDGKGNCEIAAEAADETAVRGDEVFYSRETGMGGTVNLYRSSEPGAIAEAESIALESIQSSCHSEAILFLASGLVSGQEQGPEGVYVKSEKDLLMEYYQSIVEKKDVWEDEGEDTLILEDGSGARELGKDVCRYGFYGEDCVWMMLDENAGEETAKGGSGLYIYENGEKKMIADKAVWMVMPEDGKGYVPIRSFWVYDSGKAEPQNAAQKWG